MENDMANNKVRLRNWTMLAAYIALVYSTLSVAPNFSRIFSGILGKNFTPAVNIFIVSVVMVVIGLFYGKIKTGPPGFHLRVAAIFFLYLFFILRWTDIPAEKLHLVEYGFMSYLVLKVMGGLRSRPKQYLYTVLIVGAIGCGDELIQWLLPNRVCDPKDMALNFISGILGLLLIGTLNSRKAER